MSGDPPLRLLGRTFDGFERAVAAHAEAWSGGPVEARWLGLPQLQEAAFGDQQSDLMMVPADWLPALAAAGRILPLTGYLCEQPPEGWPNAWSASFRDGVSWQEDVFGLPFHDGPQLLFTRPSLTDSPPRTWSAFVGQARALHQPGIRSGTVLAGAPDGHNNVYDYVLHLWRYGGELVTDGVINLDTPPARVALRFLRELAGLSGPQAHALDSTASGQEFAAGGVAMMVNWAGYAALAREDVALTTVPNHDDGTPTITVNAFWATCLTSSGADPDRAWSYLCHSGSAAMDLVTTQAGASGTRRSTWSDPCVLAEHPEYALFDAAHAQSRSLPRLPQLPALVDVLNELVDAVVWRGEDANAALARAQRAARELPDPRTQEPR